MRRAVVVSLGVVALLIAGAVAAYVVYKTRVEEHSVQGSSTVEFVTTAAPKPPHIRGSIEWPNFGNGWNQPRVGPSVTLKLPFRVDWVAGGSSLLEFPPALGYKRLFLANAHGDLMAYSTASGKRAWVVHEKRCTAASPAVNRYEGGTVYEAFLQREPCKSRKADGEIIAVSAGTGDVRWRKKMGPSETSPLLVGNHLYVGDWRGKVYELDARTGKTLWTFSTRGAIKGAIAYSGGHLYAGSYDGHVYALNAKTGKLLWRASSDQRLFGRGRFYSTPAVAYGRVYIGGTDHTVYSFGAKTGKRRWSYVTGGYVYGSPAVWNRRVYVGSYDQWFYALDAATGKLVWRFHANGPISGSANVVDGVVYFATLKGRTYGLDTRTGKLLWSFHDGKYAPLTTDGKRVFLLGYGKVYGLLPKVTAKPKKRAAAAGGAARRARTAKQRSRRSGG
jgi:outer membrane protein assembly factor BamB